MAKRAASKEDQIISLLESLVSRVERLEAGTSNSDDTVVTTTSITVEPNTSSETTKPKRGRPKKPPEVKQEKNVRPNLFEKMPEFNSHKSDTKIDKKLWGKNKPTPRRPKSERMEIKCSCCPKMCKVLPQEIMPGSPYRCNDCIVGRRG
jgi:hypothetical protein